MYKNIEKQQKLLLKDLVEYMPGQVISKTLVQNDKVSMTIFSFDKGEEISTHAAGGDAMVTVLEGTGKFTVGGEEFILNEGETLIICLRTFPTLFSVRKNLRCSLSYPSDFSFLSYSSKLTTADRTIIVCSHQYCFCGNHTAAEKGLRKIPKAFVFDTSKRSYT